VDALSEVLRSFRLRGSIYAVWDMGAPWGMAFTPAHSFLFHYVQSGSCMLVRQNGERVFLAAGDVAALFDGAGHRICDTPNSHAEPLERILGGVFEHSGPRKYGGRRPGCRIICGKFAVDEHESGPASLRHLPPVVHIPRESSARVKRFAATLDLLAGEVWQRQTGSERAASLLTEMLFIQVVRAVLAEQEAPASSGWVQGLRDPQLGAALAAIHAEPERPWSVDSLAAKAGLSRSVFAERFGERIGCGCRSPRAACGKPTCPSRRSSTVSVTARLPRSTAPSSARTSSRPPHTGGALRSSHRVSARRRSPRGRSMRADALSQGDSGASGAIGEGCALVPLSRPAPSRYTGEAAKSERTAP
jgi:hypothetical protein